MLFELKIFIPGIFLYMVYDHYAAVKSYQPPNQTSNLVKEEREEKRIKLGS